MHFIMDFGKGTLEQQRERTPLLLNKIIAQSLNKNKKIRMGIQELKTQ
jgi:hypothetical protein